MMEKSDFANFKDEEISFPVLEKMVVSISSPNDISRRNIAKRKSALISDIIKQKVKKVDSSIALPEIHSNLNNLKIPAEIEELVEDLEEVKVKIESDVLKGDQNPIELPTFICQPDLDIKQDFEGDRMELLQWTDENCTNRIHSNNKEPNGFILSSQIEELEEDKVKIESEVLENDRHSVELTTFISQPDLDIKQDFEDDRTETMHWTDENPTNEIHSDLIIPAEVKELNIFDLSSQIEELEEDNVKIESEVLGSDRHSVQLTTFINQSDLDIKQDFEDFDENARKVRTFRSDHFFKHKSSLKSSMPKGKQLVLKNGNNSKHTSVLTTIPMADIEKQNRKCSKPLVDVMKSSLLNLLYKGQKYNVNELVPAYNCIDDGFASCPFKTLYFDEYLKHVDTSHQVEGLSPFSSEYKLQREAIMEGWLARDVGPFQCRYCKKATVTYLEMERHQAVSHAQKQCWFYYRKFVPNDTVTVPEEVNLEDPSFFNHVIHLPDQIHLCDFKLMDDLLSSTSAKLTDGASEVLLSQLPVRDSEVNSDQQKKLLNKSEILTLSADDEASLLNESEILSLPADNECKWKDCYQTYDSQLALINHIKKNHVKLQSGMEFTCFWKNCSRKLIPFSRKGSLLLHMRIHSGEKPYKCALQGCNRGFPRLIQLTVHQRRHTGKRPYQCQYSDCFKKFSTVCEKNYHQRLHYNPEAYACQVTGCLKRYNRPSSLRKHMKVHTTDEQLETKQELAENKEKEGEQDAL